jgi:hypothetical protein
MDDGFQLFLLLIFVFWILEGIAKARQRTRLPQPPEQSRQIPSAEEGAPAERGRRVSRVPRAPGEQGQRPPTLMEILAAELERAKEAHRQMEEGLGAERPERVEAPRTATREPERGAGTTPPRDAAAEAKALPKRARPALRPARAPEALRVPRRAAPTQGSPARPPRLRRAGLREKGGEVMRGERPDVVEQFSERDREERISETWASGEREADGGASRELERVGAVEAERSVSLEISPRRVGLQRAGIKESQRPLEASPRSTRKTAAPSLDPRHLIGASPGDLRRILILREVLGPPVALREDGDE